MSQQQQAPHQLEYQQPRKAQYGEVVADLIPWLGGAAAIVGFLILAFAYFGVDNAWAIGYGLQITGFGITWWFLGIILRVLVFK
jgi:hypothetical protein